MVTIREPQRGRERAMAMVVVFIYLCLIFLVAFNLNMYAQSLHQLVIRSLLHLRAMDAAESGIAAKLARMSRTYFDSGAPDLSQVNVIFPNVSERTCTLNVTAVNLGGGNYRVTSSAKEWRTDNPGDIVMQTLFPSPFGEYEVVSAGPAILDYDDRNYYWDLNGTSVINDLTMDDTSEGTGGSIEMQNSAVIAGENGTQRISLNSFSDAAYSLDVFNLRAEDRIKMGAAGATTVKRVYDVAEAMPARDGEPSDVVCISDTETMTLVRCTRAYDTRVAGIISADPQLALGAGEGTQPLALNGIVACKVSNENGPIKRGDILVSSSVPGHAMRADGGMVRPGMMVGKAMQASAKHRDTIYVLVNKN